jgi:hypothetical protein
MVRRPCSAIGRGRSPRRARGRRPRKAGRHPGLPQTELVFADHSLVAVYSVFDSIPRTVALSEEQTNDIIMAFGRALDAPVGKEFHCLADAVFVFRHADLSGLIVRPERHGECRLTRLRGRHGNGRMAGDNRLLKQRTCRDGNYQEDRAHNGRNEIVHGLSQQRELISGTTLGFLRGSRHRRNGAALATMVVLLVAVEGGIYFCRFIPPALLTVDQRYKDGQSRTVRSTPSRPFAKVVVRAA